jgi:hypothetical protein
VKRVCILLAVSCTNHFSWKWLPFYRAFLHSFSHLIWSL